VPPKAIKLKGRKITKEEEKLTMLVKVNSFPQVRKKL
jgi:hypothetical protein